MAKKQFGAESVPVTTQSDANPMQYKSKAAQEQALKDLGIEEIIKRQIEQSNLSLKEELLKTQQENAEIKKKMENFEKPPKEPIIQQEVVRYPAEKEDRSPLIKALETEFKAFGVGKKPLRFIRKKYKGDLMIRSTATVSRNGEVVQLSYATNHESPFVIDHPDSPLWIPETNPIILVSTGEESAITVYPTDPCLQRFMIANPMFNREYYLEDKKKRAIEELQREEEVEKAIQIVNKIFENKSETSARILGSYLINAQVAVTSELPELKLEVKAVVRQDPGVLKKFEEKKTYAEMLYLFYKSQDLGLIEVKNNHIELTWNHFRLGMVEGLPEETFAHLASQYPNYISILREKTGI